MMVLKDECALVSKLPQNVHFSRNVCMKDAGMEAVTPLVYCCQFYCWLPAMISIIYTGNNLIVPIIFYVADFLTNTYNLTIKLRFSYHTHNRLLQLPPSIFEMLPFRIQLPFPRTYDNFSIQAFLNNVNGIVVRVRILFQLDSH